MKITFRIREISYGDAMCRAVPSLREKLEGRGTSSAKIFLQLLKLPPEVIRAALDAMPEEEKKDLALLLISEYKDRLLQGISRLLAKNGISASVDDLTVSEALEATVQLSCVDYGALAEKLLPVLRERAVEWDGAAALLGTLLRLPPALFRGALDRIPQDKKDEAVVSLIHHYAPAILTRAEAFAAGQGVSIRLEDLSAER